MYEESYGLHPWQWVTTAVVIVILIVIGIFVFGGSHGTPQTEKEYCLSQGDYGIRYLPLRCYKYFGITNPIDAGDK